MGKRKGGIDPSIMYGTVFEGFQPGDVVRIRPKHGDEYVAIIVMLGIGKGRSVNALLGTTDGMKNVNSDDLSRVKLTGDQKGVVAHDLPTLASEWKLNSKTVSNISKQLVPLIQQRAKTKLKISSVEKQIAEELGKL